MRLSTRTPLPPDLFDLDLPVTTLHHVDEGVRGLEWTELLIELPAALLATWELAERAGLLERARRLLGVPGVLQQADGQVAVGLSPAALLEQAQREQVARLWPPEAMRWQVMIVHASPDRHVARTLYERLTVAGVETFLDRASVPPGGQWPLWLKAAAERSEVIVVLCSRHTDQGWYTHDEIARAISGARTGAQVLLPVRLDEAALPYGLAGVQALDLRALGATPREAVGELVRRVREVVG